MDRFVHLHVHSDYSFQDGLCVIPRMVEHVRKIGQPAIALTDHGNLHGLVEFLSACEAAGLKGIPGCEIYLAPGDRREKPQIVNGQKEANYYHLTLLAVNETGYHNLMQISSRAFLEGFYYRPRADKELLREHAEGLICLTGCLQGELARAILDGSADDLEAATAILREYQAIFGNDNVFIEFQYHGLAEDARLNPVLLKLSRMLDIPLVATNDAHYITRDDKDVHTMRVRIATNTPEPDPIPLGFETPDFYLKRRDEMAELFDRMKTETGMDLTADEIEAMLDATVAIAERVNYGLPEKRYKLPNYPIPEGESLDSYFERLVRERFQQRRRPYLEKLADAGRLRHALEDYDRRLDHEIKTIQAMGFAGYFLIVQDFINWAKEQGIPVGPGRGSAAGSLVAYALGITEIDPLQYDLLFERFLNPERVTMPDIDVDFCGHQRDRVIEYVRAKYGNDSVAQIITFQTLAARGAIRDVGRMLRINLGEVDRIAKMVPFGPGVHLRQLLKEDPEFKTLLKKKDPNIKRMLQYAVRLEGVVKNSGTHAAGIVIAPGKLTDYVPVCLSKDGGVQTQYEMNALERLGLLKMDFLGLINLTIIDDCLKRIEAATGEAIDINRIPLDDPKVFELFCEGKTLGIFQFESSGMRDLLRRFKPRRFEDLIALNALYRPGPMQMLDDFIQRRHGQKPIEYELPELKPILEETYGIIVYQEQVMQIAARIAGFSMAEADNLRRAMAKKKKKEMDEMRPRFLEGAVARGVPREKAERLFQTMEKFAAYGFNKSHSAAYAFVAYQTAYLKARYPVYYMAALLSMRMHHHDDLVKYLQAAREMGIEVKPPDINESHADFTVIDDRTIRFGLEGIKGLGPAAVRAILEARQKEGRFHSLLHFVSVVDTRTVNKKAIEVLIKAGAFDSFGYSRKANLEHLDAVLERTGRTGPTGRGAGNMQSMRGLPGLLKESTRPTEFTIRDIPEWDERLKLAFERETLGVYLTGHPVERYESELEEYRDYQMAELDERLDGKRLKLAGIITRLNTRKSRRGARFAVMWLEDLTGALEVFIPPQVLDACQDAIVEETPVVIDGQLEADEGRTRLVAHEIWSLEGARTTLAKCLEIEIRLIGAPADLPERLKALFEAFPGRVPVQLNLRKPQRFTVKMAVPYRVRVCTEFLDALNEHLGGAYYRIRGRLDGSEMISPASSPGLAAPAG